MRMLVLGAGYAGLTLARRLEDQLPSAAELVVVDESPTHLVQHEVHRVIRRPRVAEVITVPLADLLDRATVRTARVEAIDRETRRVSLGDGEDLSYDYLAVCLGARTAFHGLPGVEEHATPLKCVEHAERIREGFLELCEAGGTAVVGGAGLSGIQVAGELSALARERGADGVRIRLLERFPTVAPNFPANFGEAVRAELEARDVEIRTDTGVRRATGDRIETDESPVDYDQFVWTGGITGQGAMGGERPVVRSDLRLDERAFVAGDAARIVDADGEAVPASASAAVREARAVAENASKLVRHDLDAPEEFAPRLEPYRFEVPGWIVSVGDGAVAQVGPTVLTGRAAKALKASVGAGHLGSVGAVRRAVELVEEELGE